MKLSPIRRSSPTTLDPLPVVEHSRHLGVLKKPEGCNGCAYKSVGAGFCADWFPPDPKIACLLEAPGENEILQRKPLVGAAGIAWETRLLEPLGLTRHDVLIANSIRCRPKGSSGKEAWNDFPTGRVSKHVLEVCRQYDGQHGGAHGELIPGGLTTWDPNAFVVSFHPSMLNRAPMTLRLIRRAIKRALGLVEMGYRPCVLMGDTATGLVAPWLQGGIKKWIGHYWLGKLPWGRG